MSWLTKMNKHGNKCIANVTLTKGSLLKSITSVSVKQRGFADDFIIKHLSVHAHRGPQKCAQLQIMQFVVATRI